jgi:hypothetical protein
MESKTAEKQRGSKRSKVAAKRKPPTQIGLPSRPEDHAKTSQNMNLLELGMSEGVHAVNERLVVHVPEDLLQLEHRIRQRQKQTSLVEQSKALLAEQLLLERTLHQAKLAFVNAVNANYLPGLCPHRPPHHSARMVTRPWSSSIDARAKSLANYISSPQYPLLFHHVPYTSEQPISECRLTHLPPKFNCLSTVNDEDVRLIEQPTPGANDHSFRNQYQRETDRMAASSEWPIDSRRVQP